MNIYDVRESYGNDQYNMRDHRRRESYGKDQTNMRDAGQSYEESHYDSIQHQQYSNLGNIYDVRESYGNHQNNTRDHRRRESYDSDQNNTTDHQRRESYDNDQNNMTDHRRRESYDNVQAKYSATDVRRHSGSQKNYDNEKKHEETQESKDFQHSSTQLNKGNL